MANEEIMNQFTKHVLKRGSISLVISIVVIGIILIILPSKPAKTKSYGRANSSKSKIEKTSSNSDKERAKRVIDSLKTNHPEEWLKNLLSVTQVKSASLFSGHYKIPITQLNLERNKIFVQWGVNISEWKKGRLAPTGTLEFYYRNEIKAILTTLLKTDYWKNPKRKLDLIGIAERSNDWGEAEKVKVIEARYNFSTLKKLATKLNSLDKVKIKNVADHWYAFYD